ncbi:MAG: hypothetical protein AEth_00797 [Candidatus Argoarchaeum ethanivorans]|uniref:Dockerin domain-containing protein n=1 Tax=Candidatus Argoarchaeum ethanivorans TaxID=2608793 RepID=A0A8B3S3M1_9EURY|nr:MAG: hypothetical protein AEth_00797 [Candidatus Argoarchaeum ethanivorans]
MKSKRNISWKISVFALLFAVLAVISIGCASADTIYVPEGGNLTIQQAVNNASEGDIITVRDAYTGTKENIDVTVAYLTIQSENGSASCIVNASNSNDHVFDVQQNYVNITGFTVENATGTDKAGIYLNSTQHCNISANNVMNSYDGIRLYSSSNNNITNNTANSNNVLGIRLWASSNNTLTDNNASSNSYGIRLYQSSSNTLTNNTASNNDYGIFLHYSSNNMLTSNTASYNDNGIYLYSSSNNMLTNNTANSNNDDGIHLQWFSSNNNIANNNLINNTNNNAYDTSTNQWNTSTVGNYYSDYTGSDNNSDGIGDTSYQIPGGSNIDYFPLMHPWGKPPLKGDLDGDSQITSTDAAIVLQIVVGSSPCDPETLAIADMNGDGRVSSLDALIILQMAA